MAFWMQIPAIALAALLIVLNVKVPHQKGELGVWDGLKRIDWLGCGVLVLSVSQYSSTIMIESWKLGPLSSGMIEADEYAIDIGSIDWHLSSDLLTIPMVTSSSNLIIDRVCYNYSDLRPCREEGCSAYNANEVALPRATSFDPVGISVAYSSQLCKGQLISFHSCLHTPRLA